MPKCQTQTNATSSHIAEAQTLPVVFVHNAQNINQQMCQNSKNANNASIQQVPQVKRCQFKRCQNSKIVHIDKFKRCQINIYVSAHLQISKKKKVNTMICKSACLMQHARCHSSQMHISYKREFTRFFNFDCI